MEFNLNINATLKDLDLISAKLDISEPLTKIFEIFERDASIPGVILMCNGSFFRLLSKVRFHEMMSKQYMYELFSKRKIEFFFHHTYIEPCLMLCDSTSVMQAANEALNRAEHDRFDPILVYSESGDYSLIDFNYLLLANNHIQSLTMDLLKKADQFKKEVLRIAVHDLRNPISVIQGFSQLMAKDLEENKKLTTFLDYINQSTFQMADLVNDLLGAAITEATGFTLNKSCFCIVRQIHSVINSFKYQLEQKKQTIVLETSDDNILLSADKQKISEVFSNLISNAIKYSEYNKTIRISIRQEERTIQVRVTDEGQGFTVSDLKKIFGKFQRLSAQPTGNESSTGLGLYIVKQIVDLHEGTIDVETEMGKGTTFVIALPLKEEVMVLE